MSGKDYSECRNLLYNMHAYLGNQYYYKVDRDIVKQLFLYGKSLPQEYHNDHTNDKQTKRMIASAKFLSTYGIQINVEYGSLSHSSEVEQELFQLLEQKVRTVGGYRLLQRIYKDFFDKYIEIFDHYNISRQIDDERNEPVNLLLNLSVKHLSLSVSSLNFDSREKVLDEIIHIAESWLDIMDMQPDSGIEYAMMGIDTYPIFLNNGLIFDKMCIPKQYSRKFILIMLEHLIKPWFDRAKKKYSFEDYYAVANYIMNLKCIGKVLDIPQMFTSLKVSNYKIKLILKDMSMPSKDVNSMFTSLDSESNFYKRPLIEFPLNKYVYIDYHFCGNGFYLAAYDMIKDKFPNLDREQGPYVEKMLRTEIERKGYRFRYGAYFDKDGSTQSDCDVIMNGNRIYFFEVKKRAIADEFDKIDDVATLKQLSFGMINAQKQCFFHERYIINNGEMILNHEDGGFDSIKYDESLLPAYKISVCLPEYSFLTNKLFCMNLLEAIMLGGFSTVDSSKQGQLEKLNELGRKIAQCEYDIHNRKQYKAREAFFFLYFVVCNSY